MNNRKLLTSAVLIGILGSLAAAAQEKDRVILFHGGPGVAPFAKLDSDGDGTVSRTEFEAADAFTKLDRNQDGVLDAKDLRLDFKVPAPLLLLGADGDDDRTISRAEWSAFLEAADKDSNASLSLAELHSVLPAPPVPPVPPLPPEPPALPTPGAAPRAPEGVRGGVSPGRPAIFFGGAPRHQFGPGASWQGKDGDPIALDELEALFTELDLDADGVIEESEWPTRRLFLEGPASFAGNSSRRE